MVMQGTSVGPVGFVSVTPDFKPGTVTAKDQHVVGETPLLVGCAISCYGEALKAGITRERFRWDTQFEDLFESAPQVVTLSVNDCSLDSNESDRQMAKLKQAQEWAAAFKAGDNLGLGRQTMEVDRAWREASETMLQLLDPRRALKRISQDVGGVRNLATATIDILLDHEFSWAWTSSMHAERYRHFISAIRAVCAQAVVDQYASVKFDWWLDKDPDRRHELTLIDHAAVDARLGVGGACFPHLYLAYLAGTLAQRAAMTGKTISVEDLRAMIAVNMARYTYVADRRAVIGPMRSMSSVRHGRAVLINPWAEGDVPEVNGMKDWSLAPRHGRQTMYELLSGIHNAGWRAMVWGGCGTVDQARRIEIALREDIMPAVQAVRSGVRPSWAW